MAKNKKLKISQTVDELNSILQTFDKDGIDIDTGIIEYKKAAELIKKIETELKDRELELKEIHSQLT